MLLRVVEYRASPAEISAAAAAVVADARQRTVGGMDGVQAVFFLMDAEAGKAVAITFARDDEALERSPLTAIELAGDVRDSYDVGYLFIRHGSWEEGE